MFNYTKIIAFLKKIDLYSRNVRSKSLQKFYQTKFLLGLSVLISNFLDVSKGVVTSFTMAKGPKLFFEIMILNGKFVLFLNNKSLMPNSLTYLKLEELRNLGKKFAYCFPPYPTGCWWLNSIVPSVRGFKSLILISSVHCLNCRLFLTKLVEKKRLNNIQLKTYIETLNNTWYYDQDSLLKVKNTLAEKHYLFCTSQGKERKTNWSMVVWLVGCYMCVLQETGNFASIEGVIITVKKELIEIMENNHDFGCVENPIVMFSSGMLKSCLKIYDKTRFAGCPKTSLLKYDEIFISDYLMEHVYYLVNVPKIEHRFYLLQISAKKKYSLKQLKRFVNSNNECFKIKFKKIQ